MTAPDVDARPPVRGRLLPAPLILLCGLVLVPAAIALAADSWTSPDATAYVRMAFASVAGTVVAVASVLVLLVDRLVKRAPAGTMVALTIVALLWASSTLAETSDLLLQRLAQLD
ncbi:hypothetical protein [Clavibacter phaseoli]|uniref:hypothetical protein n=1 Tax=Clavibacter phaseoli TaxID=1734031 RepID=UPI000E66A2AA|nr:hypothetical protein [Clavibacter phaseoli]RIJ54165.1 hypothetical protein DZF99_12890 [Clavibacter phaseoli]UKF30109.1 hypothetical protein FGD69_03155 [Clavibacter phaseoli]UKF36027.1 hypothetical protein FGI33_02535 [Clavibacter phaseoli]